MDFLRLPKKQTADTEFLPAALEIVETPAAPLGRAIAATISLFFIIALVWACFGKVDIIATAPGKIVSSARTKTIQPFETGVVRAIHVQDGQMVKAGDILIEIDPTINASERDRLQKDLSQAQLDTARLKSAAKNPGQSLARIIAPANANRDQLALQENLLASQQAEIAAKLSNLDKQIAQSEGNRTAVQSNIQKLQESIPLLEQRNSINQNLAEKGYGSKLNALTTQQDLIEHRHELAAEQGHLAEANAAIAALKQQRAQAQAEFAHTTLDALSQAEQKVASLSEQLVQATQKYTLQTIKAPVDGTVQQLAIHTEGGVVTPAQALLSIVPVDDHLEAEVMVSNRDIGFVYAGQEVAIKVDTFNFTKYGLLHGKVISLAQDAIPRPRPDQATRPQGGSEDDSSEPKGQELVYTARISLNQSKMHVEDKEISLTPGMAVTAEIKTGSRAILDYLLSPLSKHQQQAFHER